MKARRFLPALVLVTSACLDHATDPFLTGTLDERDESGFEVVTGTLLSNGQLRTDQGWTVRLSGPQTLLLKQLVEARIHVRGTRDEGGPLYVVDFRVLAVDGLPALDGVLLGAEGIFTIEMVDRSFVLPAALPAELTEHVGNRVWVTFHDSLCARFGVLRM
jgi:hypothetical protein